MILAATAASLVGRRPKNEDSYLMAESLGLFAVADGMGGYAGGEVASRIAVDELERFVARNRRDPLGTWPCKEDRRMSFAENLLQAAVLQAHLGIEAQRRDSLDQMGSTVACVLVDHRCAALAHVGDSRIYRLRGGALTQLTRDHSLWAEMKAAGMEVGPRSAFGRKNIVTRALGVEGNHSPEVVSIELEAGDRLLLCSDGLHDVLEDDVLARLMTGPCEVLVRAAYDAGSSDNITAVLLSCMG